MLTVLIVYSIGMVWWYCLHGKQFRNPSDYNGERGWLLLGAVATTSLMAGLFAMTLLGVLFASLLPTTQTIVSRHQLVSTHGSDTVSGSFFLGSGSISGEARYVYFEKENDGSLIRQEMPSDGVRVFEDSKDANGTITEVMNTCPPLRFTPFAFFYPVCSTKTEKIFHVPPGTVERKLTLN